MTRRHLFVSTVATLLLFIGHAVNAMPPHASAPIVAEYQRALVYAPQPEYPVEARAQHLTGSGMFLLRVPVKSGQVAEVRVVQSTGQPLLDAAAARAFKQWRFKPSALKPIGVIAPWRHDSFGKTDALLKVPVTFTM